MGGADQASVFPMPRARLIDMAYWDALDRLMDRNFEIWSMDIPPPAPALKNKREPISRGGLGNDGITGMNIFKSSIVETRALKGTKGRLQRLVSAFDTYTPLPPFLTKEDDKGGVVLSIFNIPSSATPSTIVNSLVKAARSWRSQKKKALLLKLLPTEYDQFLLPSLQAGFTIRQVEATGMMLVQGLLAHAQPEQVEEASFDSSYNLKKRHWTLDYKDVQIADSCFPCARVCPSSDVFHVQEYALRSEILTSEAKKRVHSIKSFADFKPSKVDSCIAPSGCPNALIFGQDVTNDQDLPHSIPGPGAVGTPEIKQHVEHPVGADPPSYIYYLEGVDDEPDSESEAMDIPNDEEVLSGESGASGASLESHTETGKADSHGPRTEPSRKRSAASAFDEDSLFAKIRPFVNQQIEEALLPLMSALRSREEDEHKHRQKMLALEQEKLALMRQKLVRTTRSNVVPASAAK